VLIHADASPSATPSLGVKTSPQVTSTLRRLDAADPSATVTDSRDLSDNAAFVAILMRELHDLPVRLIRIVRLPGRIGLGQWAAKRTVAPGEWDWEVDDVYIQEESIVQDT